MWAIMFALSFAMQTTPDPPAKAPSKDAEQQNQNQSQSQSQSKSQSENEEPEIPVPRSGIRRTPPKVPKKVGVGKSLYTLDAPPPGFDGKSMPLLMPNRGMEGWNDTDGKATDWVIDEGGFVHASDRDAVSVMEFGDCHLHVEYSLPNTPGRIGAAAASSGVIIHGRYEIELHNSFGRPARSMSCGALRGLVAPVANATLPAPGWQALDIFFSAPVLEDGKVINNPRITALLNGVLILNNVEITQPTDYAIATDMPATGPLILQGSSDPVIFRNLWIRRP